MELTSCPYLYMEVPEKHQNICQCKIPYMEVQLSVWSFSCFSLPRHSSVMYNCSTCKDLYLGEASFHFQVLCTNSHPCSLWVLFLRHNASCISFVNFIMTPFLPFEDMVFSFYMYPCILWFQRGLNFTFYHTMNYTVANYIFWKMTIYSQYCWDVKFLYTPYVWIHIPWVMCV